jgi:exodeoxyribonuclease VII large subunit
MSDAAARPLANMPEFSVTEISAALKRTVEDAFGFVRVRGEISNLKFHSSGHIYFDLKDEKACLNAVVWRTGAGRLKQKPQAGLEVVCTGKISTYAGSSRYQIIVEQVELAGAGALMAMLEARKKALAAEGLFDAAHKKPLPFLPEVIGVVTSPTGAVIRDIMHRLQARFPRRVLLWPVAVQGERAAAEVAAAIRGFNAIGPGHALPRPDLLIIARGGGSLEDLMAFNEEIVVRAAFESVIPLISAVGHETDTTLIDFAADLRAPTPTAAAELAVPVRTELIGQTLDFQRRLLRAFTKGMDDRRRHLAQLARVLPRAEALFSQPRQRLDYAGDNLAKALRTNLQDHRRALTETSAVLRPNRITRQIKLGSERSEALAQRLARAQRVRLAKQRQHLDALGRVLESVSYRSALDRGFALVRGEDGTIRRRAGQVAPGERLTLTFSDGDQAAIADGTTTPKPKSKPKAGGGQGSLF